MNYIIIILSLDHESIENKITMAIQEAMGCCNLCYINITSQDDDEEDDRSRNACSRDDTDDDNDDAWYEL